VNFQAWEEAGLKGEEVHRIMQQGLAHIGHISLARMSGDYPIVDASDLAGLSPDFTDLRAVVDAYRSVLDEFFLTKVGLRPLAYQSFQAQILYCSSEVASLKDLQGKKVRAAGASQSDFLAYFGATAVSVAFGEVSQALSSGVVDCALTGTLGGYSARWYESAKHLYTLPINYATGVYAANETLWQGLDGSVREFLLEQIPVVEQQIWDLNAKEGEMGILCNTTGPCELGEPGGMVRHDPTEADKLLLREALQNAVLPKWAERCGDGCVDQFNDTIGKVTGLILN
ncbi:MAG TPA: TRAP transporter substrate-binding protein DctP, partial [Devosia sp.]|nr:TRAP transporter substrate-binding protein DctP [Devosia sp.]